MGEGQIVPGVWEKNEETYRCILVAAESLALYLRDKPFRTEELRLLLAEPGWQLWGSRSQEEADLKLAYRFNSEEPEKALGVVKSLRYRLEWFEAAPLPEDCSERKFVGHLKTLVKHGLLEQPRKGYYRVSALGKTQRILGEEDLARLRSTKARAVVANPSPSLTAREAEVFRIAADVVGLASEVLGLIQGGGSPERLPGWLRPRMDDDEPLKATVRPAWWAPAEGGDVAVAALGSVDPEQTRVWAKDPAAYEQYLERVKAVLLEAERDLKKTRPQRRRPPEPEA